MKRRSLPGYYSASSTGPVTEEGKAIASQNSLKHGSYSAELVEGRKSLAALTRQLKEKNSRMFNDRGARSQSPKLVESSAAGGTRWKNVFSGF